MQRFDRGSSGNQPRRILRSLSSSEIPSQDGRKFLGSPDVSVLGGLVATTQKQDQFFVHPLVVNAIAKSIVDAHFANTSANGFHIARIAEFKPLNADQNLRECSWIFEACEPPIEFVRPRHIH